MKYAMKVSQSSLDTDQQGESPSSAATAHANRSNSLGLVAACNSLGLGNDVLATRSAITRRLSPASPLTLPTTGLRFLAVAAVGQSTSESTAHCLAER
jgi:hypothetical protein